MSGFDLASLGVTTEQFFISRTASSYMFSGAAPDGRWNAAPSETAPYPACIVVVWPIGPRKFSGGYAYVCVSAQNRCLDTVDVGDSNSVGPTTSFSNLAGIAATSIALRCV